MCMIDDADMLSERLSGPALREKVIRGGATSLLCPGGLWPKKLLAKRFEFTG
jgi:hypothetical protein